ncbi:MAG: DUF58 domain-containing protein [Planctomycetes bacterium]|nr:DUF58 domain-containing protein [Planctomycetota bacterium]
MMVAERERELKSLLEEVRRIEVQSKRLVTEMMAGGYSSVFRGSGIEFEEVREYVDGDDPRSVDWNVTARVGRPFVKKFVDERELSMLFLLDLSASMSGGFGCWSARQAAARVCACLGLSAVKNDDKVGLIAFGDDVEKFVPAKKGAAHVLRIIRDCLWLPDAAGKTDLAPPLELALRAVRGRSVLFLVSDFLTSGWAEALSRCALRHDVIAVRLLLPEMTPPERGLVRVRDPESGEVHLVDFGDRQARDAYGSRVAAWRSETDTVLTRLRVDRIDVSIPRTHDPDAIARPISRFFRMREQRGGRR